MVNRWPLEELLLKPGPVSDGCYSGIDGSGDGVVACDSMHDVPDSKQ